MEEEESEPAQLRISDGFAGWSNPSEPTTDSAVPELSPLAAWPLFPPLCLRYQIAHPQSPHLSHHRLPFPQPQNSDMFTQNDGCSANLLQANGTIPMSFHGDTYNILLSIWLMESYSRHPPPSTSTPRSI
ncbi:hypothetical protein GBA52_008595 [Prunus armeniaca]|nr:hypothetical protein GBA52_008595 [Prunus armeniaca]